MTNTGDEHRGTKRRASDSSTSNDIPASHITPTQPKRQKPRTAQATTVPWGGSAGTGKSQSNSTPCKGRSGHANSHTNSFISMERLQAERNEEAKYATSVKIEDELVPNVAIPHDAEYKATAERVLYLVHDVLERYIKLHTTPVLLGSDGESSMVAEANNLPGSLIDIAHLTADYRSMLELVCQSDTTSAQVEGNGSAKIMRESDMYPCIKALVRFTADAIEEAYRMPLQMPDGFKPLRRRIIAFDETDRTPGDADDNHRIDIGLKAENNPLQEQSDEANNKNSSKILYSNMLAVVEVKNKLEHQNQAYAQLLKYSRNMYARQNSCRFVWGLTVCNSDFRICLLCNDRLISSASIDVVKEAGRRLLVTWLVNMSLCEEDKLGRDPTIHQNSKTGEWEIMVFDDGSEDRYKLFTIIDCMRTADRTFGRHTRCYRCIEADLSDGVEGDSGNSAEQHNKREIFIKDAWAIVFRESDQKLRDEVSLLREINSKLKGNAELTDKYPTLVAGGAVKQVGKDGKYFEDSIDNVFSELGEDTVKQLTFRIHKRMAMSPIGEDIRSVKSVNELIIAAADIMEVHSAIRKKCNILHRDISVNNMLINRRTSEGKEAVHGMIIDFDCALRIDESTEREVRPEMTGTFPFMSINNLDVRSKARRTELDDWESMIYVLCWLGTFGVNKSDMEKQKSVIDGLDSPDILKWRDNNSWEVAKTKRTDMNSVSNFASRIVARFVKEEAYVPLMRLVIDLRRELFDNRRLSSMARGSLQIPTNRFFLSLTSISELDDSHEADIKTEYWDDCCGPEVVDQFERRAACADKIADSLLKVIVNARTRALESAASEQSP